MNVRDDNNDPNAHSTEATQFSAHAEERIRQAVWGDPAIEGPAAQILNVTQAAEYAGVSPKTIYRAINARRLTHSCIGESKCYRIRREWLDAWIDESAVAAEPASSGFVITQPLGPPRTANSGPYAQGQTPRRGILK
ncbi:MAG: helix-turn-helix domain-containing protein [Solirubrobacterales bacterium]